MKRLNERISIDTWKVIADRVQKLNIYDFSDREFNENLILLREMLSDLDICLDSLSRYPKRDSEVGLASLLQAIYSGNVFDDYKKANFYEKIYQLDELGIPSIEFKPVNFPIFSGGISLLKDECGATVGAKKSFTDGEFDIWYADEPLNRWYDIVNLKDANYLLNALVELDTSSGKVIVNPDDSYAVLKNFNGVFPNKETLEWLNYPGLCVYPRYSDNDMRQLILKQIFLPFDNEKGSYHKKLVRMRNNYHYE